MPQVGVPLLSAGCEILTCIALGSEKLSEDYITVSATKGELLKSEKISREKKTSA